MLIEFEKFIKEKADFFRDNFIKKNGTIRLVSHLDADGITAASIMAKALLRENKTYVVSTVHQMSEEVVKNLKNEKCAFYIFTDIGSSHVADMELNFGSNFLVIDHHEIDIKFKDHGNLLNPHCFGIDGGNEVSGAGMAYLFCKALNTKNKDLAHLAIIGALGDSQENHGFKGINEKILKDAVDSGKIEIKKGLRLFGAYSRPVHKVLEYSTDPLIPGITGSESNAIKFLKDLDIEARNSQGWRKIPELSKEEMSRLISGIIMRRSGEENPDDIIGNIYLLQNEDDIILKDAREFCTMLNACGRMDKASIGIGACMGYSKMKKMALFCIEDYRKELVAGLNKYYNKEFDMLEDKNILIINAKKEVRATIIGTIASMISKLNSNNRYVLTVARIDDMTSKASLRFSGKINVDLREVLKDILKGTGDFGGHKNAAGAVFPSSFEKEFLERAKAMLSRISLEEQVN